jgi:hypothetical protein
MSDFLFWLNDSCVEIYVCSLHLPFFFLTRAALMHGNRETLEPVLLFFSSDFSPYPVLFLHSMKHFT